MGYVVTGDPRFDNILFFPDRNYGREGKEGWREGRVRGREGGRATGRE